MTFAELCELAKERGWKVRVTGPSGRKVGAPLVELWVICPLSEPGSHRAWCCSLRTLSLNEAAGRLAEAMRELELPRVPANQGESE